MKISLFDKFSSSKNMYPILYTLIILLLSLIIILELIFLNNRTTITYRGIISQNNNLVLTNLNYLEVESILNCKSMEINHKKITYQVLKVEESVNNYTLSLKLENYYLNSRTLEITIVLKEETLYQFIVRKMKGE